ncbi:hypothetical protein [Romboutsia sp. 1001216sp1]|uniref:hypothetical protein n=1 Tax=Romboutsia sp. 1001216sp1 TaxID=2986997 RepID=UPI00232E9723|nr:hypothetical protein [Romboutsia sp. 1001216sp1]MDB8803687.1 hypothetical protein [Romboutsia sp. 1001216sp1]MDB8807811.1 hypothetical protein [Romboutsia sp. 1001216sp1]MDB8809334.1 hypothetical protein [Romboutsia sp. 1001216sp1]MDB8815083.1 hypothetical protein [Romboutsia sp. 1001216sp1]MDB8817776.1 hypothetical protein [Romboutsia sp. 1001216sp1]
MLLWIMVFLGTLLFVVGLYFIVKNYKDGKYIKKYGVISYIGLGIAVLGTILLMEPVFTKLPPNLSGVVPSFISLAIFMVAAQLLLKPTFLKK